MVEVEEEEEDGERRGGQVKEGLVGGGEKRAEGHFRSRRQTGSRGARLGERREPISTKRGRTERSVSITEALVSQLVSLSREGY